MTQATMAAPARSTRTAAPFSRLLRAELRWIFRRPRTLVGLALLGLIPVLMGIALTLVGGPPDQSSGPPGLGQLLVAAVGNGFVLPVVGLAFLVTLFLPMAATVAGADALAGETQHGSLRGWLLAPVSRGRLLTIKAFGVGVLSLTATTLAALTGVLTGFVLDGTGSMVTLSGTTLSLGEALGKVALAVLWVTVQLWAVGAVALAISAGTEHPILVLATVIGGIIVFGLLDSLSALNWLHPYLLNHGWDAVGELLRDPVSPGALWEGVLRAACYLVAGLSIAYARLTTRDG